MRTQGSVSQLGFSPLIVLILAVGFLVLSGYFIKERTSFLPRAEEICGDGWNKKDSECDWDEHKVYDVCQNIESGEYRRINGHQISGQCGFESDSESDLVKKCLDNNKYFCDYSKEPKGKRIYKTGGYYAKDSSDPLYGERDREGCVYDFQPQTEPCEFSDGIIGVPPGDSIHSAGQPVITIGDKTEKEDGEACEYTKYCDMGEGSKSGIQLCSGIAEGNVCKDPSGCGECKKIDSSPVQKPGSGSFEPVCREKVSINSLTNPDLALKLMRYYAITKGAIDVCVEADLGLSEEGIIAKSVNGEEGDLFYCSGFNGENEWKISSFDSDYFVRASDNFSADILTPYVEQAEEILQVKGLN